MEVILTGENSMDVQVGDSIMVPRSKIEKNIKKVVREALPL